MNNLSNNNYPKIGYIVTPSVNSIWANEVEAPPEKEQINSSSNENDAKGQETNQFQDMELELAKKNGIMSSPPIFEALMDEVRSDIAANILKKGRMNRDTMDRSDANKVARLIAKESDEGEPKRRSITEADFFKQPEPVPEESPVINPPSTSKGQGSRMNTQLFTALKNKARAEIEIAIRKKGRMNRDTMDRSDAEKLASLKAKEALQMRRSIIANFFKQPEP